MGIEDPYENVLRFALVTAVCKLQRCRSLYTYAVFVFVVDVVAFVVVVVVFAFFVFVFVFGLQKDKPKSMRMFLCVNSISVRLCV